MNPSGQLKPIDFAKVDRFLAENDLEGAYSYLAEECNSKYANLGLGIVRKPHSFAGEAALGHLYKMQEKYRPDEKLTDTEVKKIMREMLVAYVEVAKEQQKRDNSDEIDYDNAYKFHSSVFRGHGLPPQAWTLHVVSFLPKEQRERLWVESLNAAGDNNKEYQLALNINREVADFQLNSNREIIMLGYSDVSSQQAFPTSSKQLISMCQQRDEIKEWRDISYSNMFKLKNLSNNFGKLI
ncbi:MAG: hypothetical protein N4Q30_05895, partial [Neisseriaceae bacterium]|nr:hypothetical protein [Neisseriaceae bacterium]